MMRRSTTCLGESDENYGGPEDNDMIIVSRDEIPKENLAKPPAWIDRISKWLTRQSKDRSLK